MYGKYWHQVDGLLFLHPLFAEGGHSVVIALYIYPEQASSVKSLVMDSVATQIRVLGVEYMTTPPPDCV